MLPTKTYNSQLGTIQASITNIGERFIRQLYNNINEKENRKKKGNPTYCHE
jgi:hypothetical protein